MTNKDIARVLQETADLIKLTGGNEFRARAFSNAGRSIEQLDEAVEERIQQGSLTEISGIGQGLADDITRLAEQGKLPQHQELLARIPPGLTDVLRVKGLGPSRVRTLWQELNITSLDELEAAGRENKLAQVKGFGQKTQQNVLEQVRRLREYLNRYLLSESFREAEDLLSELRAHPKIQRADIAGRLRRRCEVVEHLSIVAAAEDPDGLRQQANEWFDPTDTTMVDENHVVTGSRASGMPVVLTITTPGRFGTVLWTETGSEAHCKKLLDTYGSPGACPDEREVYENADLPWIPPELREGSDELTAAREHRLPDLIDLSDLRGSVHNHTTYSDGANTVEEMARAARGMGLSYLVLCDHSRSLTIANGLSIERVEKQREEIAAVNQMFEAEEAPPFRIFAGIESDILADGSLDYPAEVLDAFEVVVGSIHSRFNMSEEQATDRLVRAVKNPHLDILGHLTGRLLLRREGYPVNHERVIEACAEHNVAIELNANPRRLDMDWRWIRAAAAEGIPIAINPDAHTVDELKYVRWGVDVARKGWLESHQCLNTRTLEEFADWIHD